MDYSKFTSKKQILDLIREADDYSKDLINELEKLKHEDSINTSKSLEIS
jgi:hypothetical protein